MKSEDLGQIGLSQFPLVIGGVVPVVNIDGVKPGQIKFTGALLADIYLGKLTRWNDPALQALNPDIKLPDAAITVVHRSDGSGTTFNWANYLRRRARNGGTRSEKERRSNGPSAPSGNGNEVSGISACETDLTA